MSDAPIRRHVWISGRVQGVAFRACTRDEAERLGVGGWVRNLAAGRVEAVFEGPPAAVEAALAWCAQGPRWARVESLDTRDEAPENEEGFAIR